MLFAQAPAPAVRLLSTPGWSGPFAGSAISTSVGGGKGALLEVGGGTGEGASSRLLAPSTGEGDGERVGEGVDWAAAPNGAAHNLPAASGATRRTL